MTIGISKEKLLELISYGKETKQIETDIDILEGLVSICKELDPWLPIDENTPKDIEILVYAPPYQDLRSLQSVCKWHESAGFCIDELRTPTRYKLLTEDPL